MSPEYAEMTTAELEEWRHKCEVRQILAWRVQKGRMVVHAYLKDLTRWRGEKAASRVHSDCMEQWALGNRGEKGSWFDPHVAMIATGMHNPHHE